MNIAVIYGKQYMKLVKSQHAHLIHHMQGNQGKSTKNPAHAQSLMQLYQIHQHHLITAVHLHANQTNYQVAGM